MAVELIFFRKIAGTIQPDPDDPDIPTKKSGSSGCRGFAQIVTIMLTDKHIRFWQFPFLPIHQNHQLHLKNYPSHVASK